MSRSPAGVHRAPGDSGIERIARRLGALYRLIFVDGLIADLERLTHERRASWHDQTLARYREERSRLLAELRLVQRRVH